MMNERGMSIAELMIAMALGLMLTLGLATLFSQTRQSFNQDEQVAIMQSGLRFAMETMVRDVTMAGFWGGLLDPTGVVPANDLGIDTTADCGTDWIITLDPALGGLNNASAASVAAAYDCIDSAVFAAGTDVIAVKRAVGAVVPNGTDACDPALDAAAFTDGAIYFADNGTAGTLFRRLDADEESGLGGCVENRQLWHAVYWIRDHFDDDDPDDGIPSLCRSRLVAPEDVASATGMETECLVDGIEHLQVEYGIDTDGNGVANQYVSAPTAAQYGQVTTVRIHLLARALNADPYYTNPKTYVLGDLNYTPADNFYRRAATTTVVLRNPTNLRKLGN